jgi:hypothetical protein
LFFWSAWQKIAKHNTGFGLYDLPNKRYPNTEQEAYDIIKAYDAWNLKESDEKIVYLNIQKPYL